MLGFAPLAAAPLGATGDAGQSYDAAVEETVAASAVVLSRALFQAAWDSAAVLDSSTSVAPSVFAALSLDGADAAQSFAARLDFISNVDDAGGATTSNAALANLNAVVLDDASVYTDVEALAIFPASVVSFASGLDTEVAGSATFISSVAEANAASSVENAVGVFNGSVNEIGAGQTTNAASVVFSTALAAGASARDSALVAPSVFNAPISEQAVAVSSLLASAVFFANITGNSIATDGLIRRLLWEVINTDQGGNWGNIDTSQSTAWSVINNDQTTPWQPVQTQN